MNIKVSKTSSAILPRRATVGAACYDLFADKDVRLIPFKPVKISTGLSFALPKTKRLQIMPRSSSAIKRWWVHSGIIDSDYRGVVSVVITPMLFGKIKAGDSIAQCMLLDSSASMVYNIVSEDKLGETDRGNGGFGSTS